MRLLRPILYLSFSCKQCSLETVSCLKLQFFFSCYASRPSDGQVVCTSRHVLRFKAVSSLVLPVLRRMFKLLRTPAAGDLEYMAGRPCMPDCSRIPPCLAESKGTSVQNSRNCSQGGGDACHWGGHSHPEKPCVITKIGVFDPSLSLSPCLSAWHPLWVSLRYLVDMCSARYQDLRCLRRHVSGHLF